MDDSAFLWEHVIFGPPPHCNPLTDQYEILHNRLRRRGHTMCKKMISIDSVGSAPHMREIIQLPEERKYGPTFFSLPDPYSPNRNSHLDHIASINVDFLKEEPFGDV
jgi:hypothetical protein